MGDKRFIRVVEQDVFSPKSAAIFAKEQGQCFGGKTVAFGHFSGTKGTIH